MGEIRIRMGGRGGRVIIDAKGTKTNLPHIKEVEKPIKGFFLPPIFIDKMEQRVEGNFRPKLEDVEVIYALSGSENNEPDILHNFASNEVVEEATSNNITYYTEKMIDFIKNERKDIPELIIKIHTHPSGYSELSKVDKESNRKVAKLIKNRMNGVRILFGVHAVSGEVIRKRSDPIKTAINKVRWESVTRAHEVAFFTEDSKPYEVTI